MCRALLYLGQPVLLDNLLFRPDSALVRQSTMPRMLNMLNLAGFGLRAWDPQSNDPQRPFAYYSLALPVFDRNLQNLAHKIRSTCLLAHVRGVAYSTRVEIALQNVPDLRWIAVLLDIVWNHFTIHDNFMWNYDGSQIYFDTPHVDTPWGAQADFDRTPVRDYFVESALYWLEE